VPRYLEALPTQVNFHDHQTASNKQHTRSSHKWLETDEDEDIYG
jgi:hypothetical protein